MKKFILESNDILKDSFIWNMVGNMLNAFQSVVFLVVLTRISGLVESGIFTIAYADANLFLNVGKYGMRYYQVSDTKHQFIWSQYLKSRWISSILMLIVSVLYVIWASLNYGYSYRKSWVIIGMCLFKVVDAIEDVFHGLYQQRGRLDIAAKILTIRMIFTIAIFVVCAILTKSLLITLIVSTVFTALLLVILLKMTFGVFRESCHSESGGLGTISLFIQCFPLFLGSFLSFYIGNAPKYSIDALLTDKSQACYGFITMPVFIIGLLSGFISNPIISELSVMWLRGEKKKFNKQIWLQIGIVVSITIGCLVGAYFFGVPVLSWIYHTDLSKYKSEMLILLLGGGFLGLSGLFNTIITIMRFQRGLLIGYGIVAFIAFFFSDYFVYKYGIIGASALYMILMVLLAIFFSLLLLYKFQHGNT